MSNPQKQRKKWLGFLLTKKKRAAQNSKCALKCAVTCVAVTIVAVVVAVVIIVMVIAKATNMAGKIRKMTGMTMRWNIVVAVTPVAALFN